MHQIDVERAVVGASAKNGAVLTYRNHAASVFQQISEALSGERALVKQAFIRVGRKADWQGK